LIARNAVILIDQIETERAEGMDARTLCRLVSGQGARAGDGIERDDFSSNPL